MSQSYSLNPRGSHYDCREDAQRAVEIYADAGFYYEVVECRCPVAPPIFAVKVYAKDGHFLGYCRFEERD
jgi:hypothetical protein